ncbi:MAG: FtsK/SpoIIIE domain-containing protein, partial [Leptotrichiaceae bacterium]
VNTLISTLITKKSEREVKFIMVDPKMVELMPYNGIPHLLVPVIIDPKLAAIALKWAVNEMENRYRTLMEKGVRNIEGYNSLKNIEKMPYIVIIIDELADLMMVAAGTVEESIARIAQKARAIGIHLVVATQRPSTDVITGMIKANLPSRISFALRSQIDSRTILDTPGAEKLLGQGDMLLLENGSSKLERIQGAYISDDEVIKLTTALKKSRKAVYREEILFEPEDSTGDEGDPLFQEAINVIREEGKASISLLQRKLKVGFNRASRIFEQLKENGIIDENNQLQEMNEI